MFDAIWGSIWYHFAKKTFRNRFEKRDPLYLKMRIYRRVRWLPETPPRARASRTSKIARARNFVKIRINGSGSEKLLGHGCLGWLQRHMFQKNVRTNGKGQCQKHIPCDLTRPGRRAGEYSKYQEVGSIWSVVGSRLLTVSRSFI